ncbi:unnamed protein product [Owenia fusiformis]|uniref:Uncharacterized protein n=1 Tax=Owenia fusiformis TaxID=6347 RepID=A0A8J1UDC8_OWEFU|nr:unnamed protein product [Owenia fusiformis]
MAGLSEEEITAWFLEKVALGDDTATKADLTELLLSNNYSEAEIEVMFNMTGVDDSTQMGLGDILKWVIGIKLFDGMSKLGLEESAPPAAAPPAAAPPADAPPAAAPPAGEKSSGGAPPGPAVCPPAAEPPVPKPTPAPPVESTPPATAPPEATPPAAKAPAAAPPAKSPPAPGGVGSRANMTPGEVINLGLQISAEFNTDAALAVMDQMQLDADGKINVDEFIKAYLQAAP